MAYLFHRQMAGADTGIVEGVMGLYDGVGKNSLVASTARTAQILDLPVVLLLNPRGMSLTTAALVKGLLIFSRTRFAGVILNGEERGVLSLCQGNHRIRLPAAGSAIRPGWKAPILTAATSALSAAVRSVISGIKSVFWRQRPERPSVCWPLPRHRLPRAASGGAPIAGAFGKTGAHRRGLGFCLQLLLSRRP